MRYAQRVPRPPLSRSVALLWYCESPSQTHSLERVLPSGFAQLIVNLDENCMRQHDRETGRVCGSISSGAILVGPQSSATIIETGALRSLVGVVFQAGGLIPFTRVPAHEVGDQEVALGDLWGRNAQHLRDRLLEETTPEARMTVLEDWLEALWRPAELHPAVRHAVQAFSYGPSPAKIAEVAQTAGLSSKRFIEHFKDAVGMTPKRYCRLRRLERVLQRVERAERIDWTRVALDSGYFDQAHFNHDFRSFAGLTPTAYQQARTEFRNHVKFLQS